MNKSSNIVELKKSIIDIINNLNENNFLLEKDITFFLDKCYILNYYLNNGFLDTILYDTQLKYHDNYDRLYIFRNIEKIKTFINII